MYNYSSEIVLILNLLLLNDNRPLLKESDIFTSDGDLLVEDGIDKGKEILKNKLRGYVSYVRGENPKTFPLRIMPSLFEKDRIVSRDKYL